LADGVERYQKKYDSREKMGVLTFSDIEITVLSKDAALVLVAGVFSVRTISHMDFQFGFPAKKSGWRIVHDHSPSASHGPNCLTLLSHSCPLTICENDIDSR